ncbi:deleted in malignant brain tumors 1 protein-like [Sphaerodactylus townsendi]|uniref:deleted in malignant brain tumors 1 protein-like n=1 Tax=Sphaerodactylus townsendi TaxID=933632 RepID=UPI002026CAD0|nr:deleted in malignant brain tumors 1 protein-like [Sphaerodactylus townsendi]
MSSPIFFIRMFLTYAALLHKSGAQELRLANGQNSCVGRVEFLNEGEWNSICDDGFGMNEANVICKQLGCGYPLATYGWAYFGKGSGSIMHYLHCNGSETSIWNCSHSAWNETNCGHHEDVGILCSGSINLETTTLSPELNEANSTSSPSTLADSGPTTVFTTEPPTSAPAAPTSSPEKKPDFTSAALVTTSTQTTAAPAVTAEAASDPAPTSSPEKKAAFTSAALVTTSTQTTAAPAITTEAASDHVPTSSSEKKVAFTSASLVTTSTQTTTAPAVTTEATSDPVTMTCWPEKMMAVISKLYIRSKGCSPTGLLVNNRRVRYQVKEDHVVIPMSYKAYETRTERSGNVVSYSNTVSCSGMSDGKMRTVQIRFICKINQKTKKEETHIVDESDYTGKDQMQR